MTARTRLLVSCIAAATLFVSGCAGQRTVAKQTAGKGAASSPGMAGALKTTTPGSSSSPGASASQLPDTRASRPPAAGGSNAFRIDVDMRACLERGRPATAVIRTAPGTMLVASATYSDGQSYYNYWVGAADPRGEYPVAWTPPPEAPLGRGKFVVGAQSDAGGNTAVKEFRLAAIGSCS